MTLAPNFIARPYRGVAVRFWDQPLTAGGADSLVGVEAYRRTEFIVLRKGGLTALVKVEKASTEPLFSPITSIEWLGGPEECTYVVAPDVDTGNASALAEVALEGDAPITVVEGRYMHVNFIVEPAPLQVHVIEVIPPEPAKLYDMARRVVDFDEDLPPVELILDAIRMDELARDNPAAAYMLPCRGAGFDIPEPVAYLDERPPEALADGLLLGCDRSAQLYKWFYGDEPDRVDICPRRRVEPGVLTLAKCCLLERGVEHEAGVSIVPWGASLEEVRAGLRHLASLSGLASADEAAQVISN